MTSECGHFAEEHLVDQGLLLRRLLELALQGGLLIQEVEVGVHHVLLGHEEEKLLLVHGLLLRVVSYLRQDLLLLLKLLIKAARVAQSAIEVQRVARILVSKKHRLLILRRVLQEIGTERVQVLVLKQSIDRRLVGDLLVLQSQVVGARRGVRSHGVIEAVEVVVRAGEQATASLRTEGIHVDHVMTMGSHFKLIMSQSGLLGRPTVLHSFDQILIALLGRRVVILPVLLVVEAHLEVRRKGLWHHQGFLGQLLIGPA